MNNKVDDLAMTIPEYYASLNVSFHTKTWVTEINNVHKIVPPHTGYSFRYDKLVLAAGSYTFAPLKPISGLRCCLVYCHPQLKPERIKLFAKHYTDP